MTRLIAVFALAIGLLTAGTSPAWACGDTPGFCPNPAPGHGCNWFTC